MFGCSWCGPGIYPSLRPAADLVARQGNLIICVERPPLITVVLTGAGAAPLCNNTQTLQSASSAPAATGRMKPEGHIIIVPPQLFKNSLKKHVVLE